jgi:tetratricopeptide (TPR) repeat protein
MEGPGTVIGRYRLLEKIGEGGMAVVYMAEQKRPIQRKVALKIIKLGMDTKQVIARFEAERQALAVMDHPNVAKVLDAGTTDMGRPYFVMELVKGVSITEYCDNRKLSTRARLTLFIQVCKAVQHAHHKGIIHRDLKPSNIMVTLHDGVAVPKIIDFGIAKATNQELTEKTVFTRYAQIIGTPEYMSPEQAEMSGLDIDTRTDVYSLGVVLYEMVTGVPPFDAHSLGSAAFGEIRRILLEEEPLRPSSKLSSLGDAATRIAQCHSTELPSLVKCLHRELEWIPLKAMRKDRTRRYQSPLELAEDIQRYMDGDPLSAGPESRLYRARKFVRRHRAFVAAVAAVLVVLIGGVVASTLFALRAEAAHTEAESISDFLRNDVLAVMNPSVTRSAVAAPSGEATVRSLLDNASERLEGRFADQPLAEASIRGTLGWTYTGLGLYESAEPHLERALTVYRAQLGAQDPTTLQCTMRLGQLRFGQSRLAEAETLLTEATRGLESVRGVEDPNTLLSMVLLGWAKSARGKAAEAEPLFGRCLEISDRVHGGDSLSVAGSAFGLALVYRMQGRYPEAERLYKRSLEINRRERGEDDLETLHLEGWLGELYGRLGRYQEAELLYEKVLEDRGRILGQDHPDTLGAKNGLASLRILQGRYEEAELLLTELLNAKATQQKASRVSFSAAGKLCWLYFLQARYEAAEPLFPALDVARDLLGEGHASVLDFQWKVGRLFETAQGQYDKAEARLVPAEATARRMLGQTHPVTLSCVNALAVLRSRQGRFEEAERLFTEAWESRRRKLGEDHPDTLDSLHEFGAMSLQQGRHEQAEIRLCAAYEGLSKKLGAQHPLTLKSLHTVIQLYEAWNKSDQAEKYRAKLPRNRG